MGAEQVVGLWGCIILNILVMRIGWKWMFSAYPHRVEKRRSDKRQRHQAGKNLRNSNTRCRKAPRLYRPTLDQGYVLPISAMMIKNHFDLFLLNGTG